MDDCDLEKLSVKPGKLTPVFNRNTTEYNVTVTSNVKEITFDCFTSDSNASKSISGSDGGRTVPLKEGAVNNIKIEVTAEDGTTKNYWVYVKRLSAKDATLKNIKVNIGTLEPVFNPEVLEYYCTVPCDTVEIKVMPIAPDKKSLTTVNDGAPDSEISLNIGDTLVLLGVTSPDGSNTQIYRVVITRKQIPRFIKFTDPELALQFEDPVSLTALYRPVTIRDSDPKHTFSAPILDEITRTSKVDPLNEVALGLNWRVEDYDLDATISLAEACVPLTNGGMSEKKKMIELGAEMKKYTDVPKAADTARKFSTECPVNHKVQVRRWEKQMVQIFDESDSDKLAGAAEASIQKYLASLPKSGRTQPHFEEGQGPLNHLQNAIIWYASAIRVKPKDASLHLNLGFLLEERYLAEDLCGLKLLTPGEGSLTGGHAGADAQAQESSKEEECQAICQIRGVGPTAPLSLQLKAIDAEYHHLIEAKQSGKADHVQGLYIWKSKQATQEGAAASKVSDDETTLGQAYQKYLDALSIDETKGVHHFHVGRMLAIQGHYKAAVRRLEAALGWNPQLQMAKFYLGYALSLQDGGPGEQAKEAIGYLRETLEAILAKNTEEALSVDSAGSKRSSILVSDLLRNSNVHLLRAMIQLSKLTRNLNDISDCMSPTDTLHTAALIAAQVLPTLHRGDTYQQVEWVLLEAHSALLDDLLETDKGKTALIAQRCQRLSALLKHTTIPHSTDSMKLQKRTIERLVSIEPCSSRALYLLGEVQLTLYDADPDGPEAETVLNDAKMSFRASIELEGKPAIAPPPEALTEDKESDKEQENKEDAEKETEKGGDEQEEEEKEGVKEEEESLSQMWWQEKKRKEAEEKKKVAEAAAATFKPAAGGRGGAAAGRGGAAAGRGGAAAGRGGAVAGRGGAAAGRGGAAAGRGGAAAGRGAARGGAATGRGAVRGTAAAARGGRGAPASGRGSPAVAVTEATSPAPGPIPRSMPKAPLKPLPLQTKAGPAKPAAKGFAASKRSPIESPSSKDPTPEPSNVEEKPATPAPETPVPEPIPANTPINKKTYHPRLGLARALARKADDLTECTKYYNEVIDLAPEVHDAYIESAELLAQKKPLAAVDIYSRFPVSENPTFDDAYIFGEIIRLLMKLEKYDDSRLEPAMITIGQVMGIGYLDKYVKTLEDKFRYDILKNVFAGVHKKALDDPQMQAFFKMKFWT